MGFPSLLLFIFVVLVIISSSHDSFSISKCHIQTRQCLREKESPFLCSSISDGGNHSLKTPQRLAPLSYWSEQNHMPFRKLIPQANRMGSPGLSIQSIQELSLWHVGKGRDRNTELSTREGGMSFGA